MAGLILLLNIFGLIFTVMCFIAQGYGADFVEFKGESKPFFSSSHADKKRYIISLYIIFTV